MSKTGLGRGLGALLAGGAARSTPPAPTPTPVAEPPAEAPVRHLPLNRIHPSPLQPRKDFLPEALQELADSIREQGIVQPLIVRTSAQGFELIAGERRWRAAQQAGLTEAPVVVREATDREVVELALIENLQRENLNPIEEAVGYSHLAAQFQLTQEDIAKRVGKSRAVVANALRLLKLPEPVRELIRHGQLSVGHAKVLLGLPDPVQQQKLAERVLAEALNVRQTEQWVARLTAAASAPTATVPPKSPASVDPHHADLENRLRERFGTQVHLRYRAGRGALEIRYFSDDELNRLLDLLGVSVD
ncbi:MAG: ParB/RepB/Spo0J family partition protein [Verrucomicrobia bacterium]|nr:ParB/RepB/Spo0J family partition protein [Verrucomicrobiota bacterium]